jgi:hypothetical protein
MSDDKDKREYNPTVKEYFKSRWKTYAFLFCCIAYLALDGVFGLGRPTRVPEPASTLTIITMSVIMLVFLAYMSIIMRQIWLLSKDLKSKKVTKGE